MQLELNTTQLSCFSPVAHTTLFAEETLESIVPDACPDILRILTTTAQLCIRSREVRDGRLEVRGVICAQVLYLPDGAEGVRRMEVSLPVSLSMEDGELTDGCALYALPRAVQADSRLLNPRKIHVRAETAVEVFAYAPWRLETVSACGAAPSLGIQEKRESCPVCVISGVRSKSFSFADELSLPGSKPDLEELLCQQVRCVCGESRLIGNKLIFKGQAMLSVLYRDAGGGLTGAEFELPFSQIMEMEETGEESECEVEVFPTELTLRADGEDHRTLSISMAFLAQAVVRENRTVELLSDLYSTAYPLSVEGREEEACRSSCRASLRQEVREVVETPVPVRSVVSAVLQTGEMREEWEGKTLCLSAETRLSILYQGEDGDCYAVSRAILAQCRLEGDPAVRYESWCRCAGERYFTPTTGGVEVRFTLDVWYRAERWEKLRWAAEAQLEETAPLDHAGRPSVVLRAAETGESLWELAKAYFTTSEEIVEANGLGEREPQEGKLLLIPKKR